MIFTSNAYNDIINTIGNVRCESGGLLFGYLDDYVVREFIFDENAQVTAASYTMNTNFLNKEIKRLWEEKGLACIGFIHSHPYMMKTPSYLDIDYFRHMFKYMPRDKYLVPIVSTIPDGGFQLNPCVIYPKAKNVVVEPEIRIIMEPHVSKYGYDRIYVQPEPEPEVIVPQEEPKSILEEMFDSFKDLFNGFFKN